MGKRRNEVPPHLFAVSDEAYRNILIGMISYDFVILGAQMDDLKWIVIVERSKN